MLIIELTYKKPIDEVNNFLDQHRSFLNKYYENGIFLASGPKNPRDGGIIIAVANRETINTIILEDPFYQYGISDYRIIEFEPNRYCPGFEKILEQLEKSCS